MMKIWQWALKRKMGEANTEIHLLDSDCMEGNNCHKRRNAKSKIATDTELLNEMPTWG
jgi:hypothetical protein